MRWDPCRPVHVVVRPQGEPAGGRQAVTAALEEVGAAAGLVFVVDGETDEPPALTRAAVDRARYGDRWSPVLVTWSDGAEHPPLAGALGLAGPAAAGADDRAPGSPARSCSTRPGSPTALQDDIGRRRAEAVLVHELAHLVGLGHSRTRSRSCRRPTSRCSTCPCPTGPGWPAWAAVRCAATR